MALDMQKVLDFLGDCSPEVQTTLGCGLLWNSLRISKQKALYIENFDASKPMTICVGIDGEAPAIKQCVERWAKEKGFT